MEERFFFLFFFEQINLFHNLDNLDKVHLKDKDQPNVFSFYFLLDRIPFDRRRLLGLFLQRTAAEAMNANAASFQDWR